jgi:hypothetical protein
VPGGRLAALPSVHALPALGAGGAAVAFLLICMSLVVFLGGEAADGGAGVRWALGAAFAVVAPFTVLSALVLAAGLPLGRWQSGAAGVVLARLYASPAAADAVGLLVMAGTAALIVAEFIALTRLWRVLLPLPEPSILAAVAAFFLAADAASLINPWRFYTLAITPSLIALYLSQAIVFAAYPRLGHRGRRATAASWAAAVVAGGCAIYGLFGALSGAGIL